MAAFPFFSAAASLVLVQLAAPCSAQHLNLTGPFHLTNYTSSPATAHNNNNNNNNNNTLQPLNLTTHTAGDGCVHLPIIHSTNMDHFARRGIQLALNNRSDVAYYAQLEIGTPPQTVYTQLDTGSFELWVNPDCTTLSSPSDSLFCQRIGHYNPSSSSTAIPLGGTTKTLHYGIGSATISYVTDVVSLAGATSSLPLLKKVQFGIATSSKDAFSGILGIGYGEGLATKYPNFIDQLYAQNVTKVKAYTLALGSKSAKEGTIVFGGVDTSKFSGRLAKIPVIPAKESPDGVPRFWVHMNGISLTPPKGSGGTAKYIYEGSQIPAFLDSGSTMTILPPKLASRIAKDFGSSPEPDGNGFFQVGCEYVGMNGTVDFEFVAGTGTGTGTGSGSGQDEGNGNGNGKKVTVTVRVPYKEMIREVVGEGDAKTCFLGVVGSESFTLLGDTFLRSAYAVFDLQTHSIWLTQASSCGSTPAALKDVTDLERVVGKCAVQPGQKEAVVDVISETSIAAPTASSSTSQVGGGGTGTFTTAFVTTTLAVHTASTSASATASLTDGGVSGIAATAASGASGMWLSAGSGILGVVVSVGVAVLASWV
ncbi:aspartic peptidase domain-containing protein [Copromyces sp. CBS 386.78]|nr:aspartic peptidase domain-containing protein [Copromyces sp. CBS 386.78]